MKLKKRILVAPLNWGLGHATRCIPIINALIEYDFEPIIASDGDALRLLQKEFPELQSLELPSYNITYSKNPKLLKLKLFVKTPSIIKAINAEKKQTKSIVKSLNIEGIISDDRLGVRSVTIPSIIITHQLNVLSGNTTWLSSIFHRKYIRKYDECWVPDVNKEPNLSGKLGHLKTTSLTIKYLGAISRFIKIDRPKKYDLLILLSGPEPQRSLLEVRLINELKNYNGKTVFVQGILASKQNKETIKNVTLVNYMQSTELEKTISESELVLCRSGYTTILDLVKMEKRAFFIPTPGQYEQKYLAKRLDENKIAPMCDQDKFKIECLKNVKDYSGFKSINTSTNYEELFSLF